MWAQWILTFIFLLSFNASAHAATWVPVKNYRFEYPVQISGTYRQGSNVTEPKPVKSKYLEVITGGAVLIERGAGLFLRAKPTPDAPKNLYYTIEYPNPADPSHPLVNDFLDESYAEFSFSSPDIIKGLWGYYTYEITVKIFAKKESAEPMDVLKQNVRSYVDTQGETLIFRKVLGTFHLR